MKTEKITRLLLIASLLLIPSGFVFAQDDNPSPDPGWYDLVLAGVTLGTPILPQHSFRLEAGVFEIYLIESANVQ